MLYSKKNSLNLKSKFLFFTLILSIFNLSSANAEQTIFEWNSSKDTYDPTSLDYRYNLDSLSVRTFDSDPKRVYFFLYFKSSIFPEMFKRSTTSPWAAVLIYYSKPSSNQLENFRISTTGSFTLPNGNNFIGIKAGIPMSDGNFSKDFGGCNPYIHSNIDAKVNWVALSIYKDCAQIPNQFYVSAYAESDSSNSNNIQDWDYAPNQPEFVDMNSINPTPTPTPIVKPTPIIRMSQNITYEKPEPVKIGDQGVLIASSDSGLYLGVESQTPEICDIVSSDRMNEEGVFYFDTYKAGNCKIIISQDGDVNFFPATPQTVFLKVLPAQKATPAPVQKRISGNASTSAKPSAVPSSKATTSSKIGGSSKVTTKPSPSSTKK